MGHDFLGILFGHFTYYLAVATRDASYNDLCKSI